MSSSANPQDPSVVLPAAAAAKEAESKSSSSAAKRSRPRDISLIHNGLATGRNKYWEAPKGPRRCRQAKKEDGGGEKGRKTDSRRGRGGGGGGRRVVHKLAAKVVLVLQEEERQIPMETAEEEDIPNERAVITPESSPPSADVVVVPEVPKLASQVEVHKKEEEEARQEPEVKEEKPAPVERVVTPPYAKEVVPALSWLPTASFVVNPVIPTSVPTSAPTEEEVEEIRRQLRSKGADYFCYANIKWRNAISVDDGRSTDALQQSLALRPPKRLLSYITMKAKTAKATAFTGQDSFLFIVLEGKVSVKVNGDRFVARAKDSFGVKHQTSYSLTNGSTDKVVLVRLKWSYSS